eukprot:CAMPEP_0174963352 /NCGR_PEP_ID=MMETSP0004_2-20121128/5283_1 /TAXON_ID=420556 /ORGANISM="Ochromonas sp., Strain CCMP1393" /LENGTH=345 /DNA_ID=CAMNT_0016211969 /DNA_START=90 /DNA_END=1127 /DNA_ORIENTATION=+
MPELPPKTKNSDDKEREQKWEQRKKVLPFVVVPLVALISVTTDIINNIYHRRTLEEYAPLYVQAVRDYYGFDDEDPVEMARIKFVNEEEMKPVDVVAQLRDGTTISLNSVEGGTSIDELCDRVARETKHDCSGGDVFSRNGLLFQDSPSSGKIFTNSTAEEESPKQASEALDGEGFTQVSAVWRHPSLWDSSLSSTDSHNSGATALNVGTGYRSLLQEYAKNIKRPLHANLLYARYIDYLSEFMGDLTTYTAYGGNIGPIINSQAKKRPVRYPIVGVSSLAPKVDTDKLFAIQRISDLERRLKELEEEKRSGGYREIDAIDADIRRQRVEISALRRKYVNYFYFF